VGWVRMKHDNGDAVGISLNNSRVMTDREVAAILRFDVQYSKQ
jgi:hypothetical protein